MNRQPLYFSLIFVLFLGIQLPAQTQESEMVDRITAIKNNGFSHFETDGITIAANFTKHPYTEDGLKDAYKAFDLSRRERKTISKDDLLALEHTFFERVIEENDSLIKFDTFYFLKSDSATVTMVNLTSVNDQKSQLKREALELILSQTIPESKYERSPIDSIDFVGRTIVLGPACRWMNVANVQCPHYGQFNWSVHRDSTDAYKATYNQFLTTLAQDMGEVETDQQIPVIFEGNPTKARKVVFRITGMTGFLLGESGGRHLTIYYVNTKVRGHYVSCILSHWNSDKVNEDGLPPLLAEVMTLDNLDPTD